MSRTVVNLPLIACLLKAEQILGADREWVPERGPNVNAQATFLIESFEPGREASILDLDELEAVAARSADEINAFLEENGFSIKLDPFVDPDSFGVAAILTALLKWQTSGTQTQLYADDGSGAGTERRYPAVEMSGKDVVYLRSSEHDQFVVQIPTVNGDEVFLTILDDDLENDALRRRAQSILDPSTLTEMGGSDALVFPMVDLDQEVDISWLLGLSTTDETSGRGCFIAQAKQRTKVAMNHKGVKVKSAAAMEVAFECMPHQNRIDKPFLLVIRRPGLPVPILVARITQDDWKDPGELDSE